MRFSIKSARCNRQNKISTECALNRTSLISRRQSGRPIEFSLAMDRVARRTQPRNPKVATLRPENEQLGRQCRSTWKKLSMTKPFGDTTTFCRVSNSCFLSVAIRLGLTGRPPLLLGLLLQKLPKPELSLHTITRPSMSCISSSRKLAWQTSKKGACLVVPGRTSTQGC